ncbi:MAG: DUF4184 family protein, partial [Chloroflexales bacterium]|nr:DUF4184 family protein [Chloroflexales bacterium]
SVGTAAFFLTIIALALGALRHVAWDAFTHASGWAVLRIPALSEPLITAAGLSIAPYKLLQHASTILGLRSASGRL